MPGSDLFARLGFLIVEQFVDPPLLNDLVAELEASTGPPAKFYYVGAGWQLDESVRRARWLEPSPGTRTRLDDRLRALRPRVEDHFQVALEAFEEPQFLRYSAGDYMRFHVDTDANAEGELGQRKVSVIIVFNEQDAGPSPGSYAGGALVFGIPVGDRGGPGRMMRLPFPVRAGLLVAFPSRVPHEVQPVSRGVRYSAVTWFR